MQYKNIITAIVLSIIGTVSICACSQKTEEFKSIDIGNAYDTREPVMASDYFSSIEYIPLETTEASLLNGSGSLNLAVAQDRLLVLNNIFGADPYVKSFDFSGKMLQFNARFGRAEGEFYNAHYITVYDNEVFLIQQNDMLIYDLDGNYRETIKPSAGNFLMNRPFIIEKRLFGLLGNDFKEKKIFIDRIDKTGQRIYGDPIASYSGEGGKPRYISRGGVNYPLPPKNPGSLYNQNEEVFFMIQSNDTLYTIDKERLQKSPEAIFDYGKYQDSQSPKRVTFLLETPSFLMTKVLFKKDLFKPDNGYLMPPFIYDYATGKTRILTYNEKFDKNGFVNDINNDALLFMPELCRGNKMYELIDAIDFIDMAEGSSSPKIKAIAATITEESNPVLVIGTLK